MDTKKLAAKLEKASQTLYDLRDECPADKVELWEKLDKVARELAQLSAQVEKLGV